MIKVLDHGFVRHVESYGRGDSGEMEAGIIEAARQSTQGAFRGWDTDAKLLKYLYGNRHDTPFEFAGLIIEVRAPIFVFREWHRHRTQSYNEMSARYSPLPDLNYMPTLERLMAGIGGGNKQAGAVTGAQELDEENAKYFLGDLEKTYRNAEATYQAALKVGVPKELARIHLPVGRYSQMRAHASLRNWLGFLTLRMDPGAQYEIREFANAVGQIIAEQFPHTWEHYMSGRRK